MSLLNTIQSSALTRIDNVSIVELPELGRIKILYGVHDKARNIPPELKNSIVKNSAALVLENIGDYASHPAYNKVVDSLSSEKEPEYFPFVQEAKHTNLPILFIDSHINHGVNDELSFAKYMRALEFGLGLGTGYLSCNCDDEKVEVVAQRQITRRNFLRLGGIALSGYLVSPYISSLGVSLTSQHGVGFSAAANYQKFTLNIHPELLKAALAHRNLLMAYKLLKILHEKQFKGKDITLLVGAEHVEIEDMLIDFERGALTMKQMAATLSLIKGRSPLTYSTIGEYWYDQKNGISRFNVRSLPELN